ncbi:MAG TPA: DUF4440 domain-containing protein [Gemmatimonadales bacterium]|nr:DUF4440 domain-containing protein [Gemmatimonadales bacterium]
MLRCSRCSLLVMVIVSAACGPKAPPFTAADEAALRAVFEAGPREMKAADWDAWAKVYTADAILQPPNHPPVRGQTNILAFARAFPPIVEASFGDVEVTGEGNLAYATSSYVIGVQGAVPDSGKQLLVFRRPPGGAWMVVAASFSSNRPVPAAPAPAAAPGAR